MRGQEISSKCRLNAGLSEITNDLRSSVRATAMPAEICDPSCLE
jgi:hypothetical protein